MQEVFPFGPTTEPTITPTDKRKEPSQRPDEGQEAGRPWVGVAPPRPLHDFTIPAYGHDLLKYLPPSRNPLVRLGLDTVSQGVFWSGWDVLPQTDYERHPEWTEIDQLIGEDLQAQFDRLRECTLQDSMESLLEDARIYGVGIAELVWVKRGGGRGFDLIKIRVKNPYDFDFSVDGFDNLVTVRHVPSGSVVNAPEIASRYLILPWPMFTKGNWYGRSDLLSIRYDVEVLEAIERAMAQGVRYLSIRPILHWYEARGMDPGQLSKIRQELLELDSGSVASLPMKTVTSTTGQSLEQAHKVEVLGDRASPEGLKQAQSLRDMFAKRIMNSLGVPDDLGMSGSRVSVGSYAKAQAEMSLLNAQVVKAQAWLEQGINRVLIPLMLKWNWARLGAMQAEGYQLPALTFREIEEDALLTHGQVIFQALDKGLISITTAQKRLGFEVEDVPPTWGKGDLYPLFAGYNAGVFPARWVQKQIGAPAVGPLPIPGAEPPPVEGPPAPTTPGVPPAPPTP